MEAGISATRRSPGKLSRGTATIMVCLPWGTYKRIKWFNIRKVFAAAVNPPNGGRDRIPAKDVGNGLRAVPDATRGQRQRACGITVTPASLLRACHRTTNGPTAKIDRRVGTAHGLSAIGERVKVRVPPAQAVVRVVDMLQTKTYMARPGEIEPKWWLVDATDKVVGRLASDMAMLLMGKNRPTYTPHVDNGDYVVVINAEKVVLTGKSGSRSSTPGIRATPAERAKRPATPAAPAGADPPRGRPPHAAQEQAGLQDAGQAEDLRRRRASPPGPAPEPKELGIKD